MSNKGIKYEKQQKLFDATNGGFDIICKYYPQIIDQSITKKFRIREDDKSASAAIKKLADGNFVVTDFGGDATSRNAIQIAMMEDRMDYREAMAKWCGEYGIGSIQQAINKAGFEMRPASLDEKDGDYYFKIKEVMSESDLELLGPKVEQKHCEAYNLVALDSFTFIKDRKAQITSSNENYPIYLIEEKDENGNEWKKIYQPLSWDKGYRFRYTGNKPKDYINGLPQLRMAFEKHRDQEIGKHEEGGGGKFKPTKLKEAIIGSGERDALNICSLGFLPIWFNSETASISEFQMKMILDCVDVVYYLPDLDKTGLKQADKRGLEHLDLRIIKLPQKLKSFKDNRGKFCKDFRDYIAIYPQHWQFQKLLDVAMPMRFYDQKFGKEGYAKYEFNPEHCAQFLQASGFYTLENKNLKEGAELVLIKDNVVKTIMPREIKSFIRAFCLERNLPIAVRNMVRTTTKLNDSSMLDLVQKRIDFCSFDQHSQFTFFKNKTIKVTGDDVKVFMPGAVEKYVWEEEVIQHTFHKKDAPFTITRLESGKYDIVINDTSSKFFCFLINSSRIHWQTELEVNLVGKSEEEKAKYRLDHKFDIAGPLLTEEEKIEQKQHLLNKLFALGYMLHRYKNPTKPWAIWAMDNKLSPDGESHGRSGKSFCWKAIRLFMKSVTLPGRNPKLTENPHVFERVTEHTRYVLVDDSNEQLKFDFFFDCITGEFIVNPKNNKSYEIPQEISPKFVFTSNFVLKRQDPSTIARLLYTVFSDYYHEKGEETEYSETRKISDDFDGKNLFGADYTELEWNNDYNIFLYLQKFYLSVPGTMKINPPMNNVSTRQQMTIMGDAFKTWADTYFELDGSNVDSMIERKIALDDFTEQTNLKGWSTIKFTKALKAFCKLSGYIFNPKVFQNSAGRISRKNDLKKTADMIYIQTKPIKEIPADLTENEPSLVKADKNANEDGLPF